MYVCRNTTSVSKVSHFRSLFSTSHLYHYSMRGILQRSFHLTDWRTCSHRRFHTSSNFGSQFLHIIVIKKSVITHPNIFVCKFIELCVEQFLVKHKITHIGQSMYDTDIAPCHFW